MTTALLFSGGLDSLALWHLTGRPTPVYVMVGAPYQAAELDVLAKLSARVPGFRPEVVPGPPIGRRPAPDGHIPHRNLVLLTTAAAATGVDRVLLGALLGEASRDKSPAFLRAATRALTASEGRQVTAEAPARWWTKTGLIRRFARAHPGEVWQLELTRSCYAARGACENCPACFRRAVALYRAGLTTRRPTLPTTGRRATAWTGLRTAGPARWPALAINNAGAALALAGIGGRRP